VLLAMLVFSLTMSISPGPVNMVIVASGANHGFWRTLPFVSGATIGFTLLLVFVAFWFMRVVTAYPAVFLYLGLAGSAFIVYIGYRIATSRPEIPVEERDIPSFAQGFLMQWLNPKAWIACTSGAALFSGTLLTLVGVYFAVCYLSLAAWALLGDRMSVLLSNSERIRLFNLSMGSLLIATAVYMTITQVASQAR
jgi:threonine/homoserine/homoserine lactone efflux protein